MEKKYSIGFFCGILLLTALLCAGYRKSYDAAKEGCRKSYGNGGKEKGAVQAKGEARKNGGFYLCARGGRVVVCLGDRKTVYETTGIYLRELPKGLRDEIKRGKFVKSERQLYGFLENYTS